LVLDINCLEIFIPQYNEKIVASKVSNMLEQFKKEDEKIECLNQIIEYHKTKNFKDDLTLITLRHDYKNEPLLLSELDSYEPILKYLEGELSKLKDIKNFKNVPSFKIANEHFHSIPKLFDFLIKKEISLIHNETKLIDFTHILSGLSKTEITHPIIWIGNQTTLFKIFDDFITQEIIEEPYSLYKTLNLCFRNKAKDKPFEKPWKKTRLSVLETKKLKEEDKIEGIKAIFT